MHPLVVVYGVMGPDVDPFVIIGLALYHDDGKLHHEFPTFIVRVLEDIMYGLVLLVGHTVAITGCQFGQESFAVFLAGKRSAPRVIQGLQCGLQ